MGALHRRVEYTSMTNPIVFAMCPADDTSIEEAKAYIQENHLTQDDAKLYKQRNTVIVELKRIPEGWIKNG